MNPARGAMEGPLCALLALAAASLTLCSVVASAHAMAHDRAWECARLASLSALWCLAPGEGLEARLAAGRATQGRYVVRAWARRNGTGHLLGPLVFAGSETSHESDKPPAIVDLPHPLEQSQRAALAASLVRLGLSERATTRIIGRIDAADRTAMSAE